ncbi:zinc ribbon domain-containing protein [Paenibacillus sp. VCA1]|uniref:zinc ribbon domain-containing protein n=1 Tax=Paenibacillus sp. VCA1 TaxID=3039148 RepID=UPI002871798C|nr:zinc ribbon domain-containing protein [Paenibacillus sp. VCA1]MDR9852440.1 zinc ribbon domain-containing protein [Paenibacillus sp. VCA1]
MKILQRLKDGANRATEKAQGAVEISKLNSQIADIEKDMELHFIEMGRVFYEGYSEEDMTLAEKEMLKHCKACDELQEEIEQLRARVAELKNEKLCKCGRTVALDANFCPACGRSLKGEAPVEARGESRKPQTASFEDEDYGETKIYREPIVKEEDDVEFELAFDREEVGAASERLYDFPGGKDWREPEDEEIFADERERRQAEELERERERQMELDQRIRFWKENNDGNAEAGAGQSQRDTVKCQICRADLPKGSKWCPRCGAEQI